MARDGVPGNEQALSLAWALRVIAGLAPESSIEAIERLFAWPAGSGVHRIRDSSWRTSDDEREAVIDRWNAQYDQLSGRALFEEDWYEPLWRSWLHTPKMVFAENLTFLLDRRGRGSRQEIAKVMRRDPATVSRWGNWREHGSKVRVPPDTAMPAVLDFFGLPPTFDLRTSNLFLDENAVQESVLRGEGKHYLDSLSGSYLRQAVERLREESNRWAATRLERLSP